MSRYLIDPFRFLENPETVGDYDPPAPPTPAFITAQWATSTTVTVQTWDRDGEAVNQFTTSALFTPVDSVTFQRITRVVSSDATPRLLATWDELDVDTLTRRGAISINVGTGEVETLTDRTSGFVSGQSVGAEIIAHPEGGWLIMPDTSFGAAVMERYSSAGALLWAESLGAANYRSAVAIDMVRGSFFVTESQQDSRERSLADGSVLDGPVDFMPSGNPIELGGGISPGGLGYYLMYRNTNNTPILRRSYDISVGTTTSSLPPGGLGADGGQGGRMIRTESGEDILWTPRGRNDTSITEWNIDTGAEAWYATGLNALVSRSPYWLSSDEANVWAMFDGGGATVGAYRFARTTGGAQITPAETVTFNPGLGSVSNNDHTGPYGLVRDFRWRLA